MLRLIDDFDIIVVGSIVCCGLLTLVQQRYSRIRDIFYALSLVFVAIGVFLRLLLRLDFRECLSHAKIAALV